MKIQMVTVWLASFQLLAAGDSYLKSTSVTFQDHLLVASVGDPEDPTLQPDGRIQHALTVTAESESWNVGLGVANALSQYEQFGDNHPFVLEKKHLIYTRDTFRVDFGDSGLQLGRGIALDLYRDEVFGIHNTLEGISTRYDFASFKAAAFAGRVNTLRAPVVVNPVENLLADRELIVAGAQIQARTNARVDARTEGETSFETAIALHYFSAAGRPLTSTADKYWHTVGVSFSQEGIWDGADVYVETNGVLGSRKTGDRIVEKPTAFGTYGALTYSPDNWRLKLEAKDYRHYDFEFRRPPTLEEDIVTSFNIEDISATRLQAERRIDRHSVTASGLAGYDRTTGSQLYHGVMGTRLHWGRDEVESKVGYRIIRDESELKHGQVKTKISTFPGQSVELLVRKQLEMKNLRTLATLEDRNVVEGTYNLSQRWSVGVGFEYIPTNFEGNYFFNSAVAYKAGATSARMFMGTTSGGSRCSGGVCRRVPPFSGAMLEGFATF